MFLEYKENYKFFFKLIIFLLVFSRNQAASFEIKNNNNKNITKLSILDFFAIFKSMILYPGKMPSITGQTEEEIKQLNYSNQVVLAYTATLSTKGLNLKLAKGYETHWTGDKREKFKEKIILCPNELLKANTKIGKLIQDDSSIITPEWFEKESLNNPLFLLGECSTSYCPLTRFNTNAREEFENQILETTKNDFSHFDKNKDVLTYTSFACGALFPDLIILTKLMDQGFKKINLNLIDTSFEEYIEILKQRGDSISFDVFDKKIKDRGFWLRYHTYCLTQFLEWFANESGVTVNIYGSAQSYIQECLNNVNMKSDIVIGIDYMQDNPYTLMDYKKLVFSVLHRNGCAFSIIGNEIDDTCISEIDKKTSEPSEEDVNFVFNLKSVTNFDLNNPYQKLSENFYIVDKMSEKIFRVKKQIKKCFYSCENRVGV